MAEVAAGALVAEQVIATTVEGGALAGYAVSKPTMPLKASFVRFGTAPRDDAALALARSHHTTVVAGHKAFIFGGECEHSKLASNHMHSMALPSAAGEKLDSEYACYPAISRDQDDQLPRPRTRHAACVQGHELAVFGGCDEKAQLVDHEACIWIWDTTSFKWHKLLPTTDQSPAPRYDHKLFTYRGHLVLHGGRSDPDTTLNDTWFFDFTAHAWTRLPDAPVHSANASFADGTLYLVTKAPEEAICRVWTLHIGDHVPGPHAQEHVEWRRVDFQSEADSQGPALRSGAGLVPITTGYGRQYLAYIFGCQDPSQDVPSPETHTPAAETSVPLCSDLWTYQLPSKSTKPNSWTDIKPAAVKDAIRDKLGYSSGTFEWAEVEVMATEQIGHQGKVHPGPRAFFGADSGGDGKSIVLWGGVNPKGEKEADGWLITFE